MVGRRLRGRIMSVRGAHLVGSVPLADVDAVLTASTSYLGGHLRRLPDGETGIRANWIQWQQPKLAGCPQLVPAESDIEYTPLSKLAVAPSVSSAHEIDLGAPGYAAAALASYARFVARRDEGDVTQGVRFQVSLPTPLAVSTMYVDVASRGMFEQAYEAAIMRDLSAIVDAIPPSDLAIQWDTAVEFALLEGLWDHHLGSEDGGVERAVVARLVRIGNAVPSSVDLGYHLCYGDARHQHFCEPADAGWLTRIANGIVRGVSRSVQWIHLPVPVDRSDEAYYAPLVDLNLADETELYLGLIHDSDGVDGARRRVDAASAAVPTFGVATECGLGRRSPDTVADLFALHAAVAAPHP